MADSSQGGLLGVDPSLLLNMGLGLLSMRGATAGQTVGGALQGGLQNYYAQKQAQQGLQKGNIDLQSAQLGLQRQQGMYSIADQLMQQVGQSPQAVDMFHHIGGLLGDPAPQRQGSPGPTAQTPGPAQVPQMTPQMTPPMPQSGSLPGQPSMPPWLTPPSATDISRTPIGGMDPRLTRALAAYNMKDPVETDKATDDRQLQIQQQKYAPVIGRLETLAKLESPTSAVSANDDLKSAWQALAPQYGLDPAKDFNDNKVRQVFAAHANTLRSALSEPLGEVPVQLQNSVLPDQRRVQTDPITGKQTIAEAGPDVLTARQRFQNAIDMQHMELDQSRSGVPAGYEKAPSPQDPTALRFIPGGPADPMAAGGGLGSRNEVMFQRVASSAQAATRAMRNIAELPITASSGWLGGAQPSTSLLGSVKGVLANKVTGQEAQDYKTMLAGISRNLATVETAGLSPGGSLTHSMDSLTLNEGDTQMTKLRKMAEMRQILEENLGPQLANPKLPPSQQELVRGIIQSAREAVPFTQSDITALQRSKNPKQTIMDFASGQGLPMGTNSAAPNSPKPNIPATNAKGWQLHQDAKGNRAYVAPNGRDYQAVQ